MLLFKGRENQTDRVHYLDTEKIRPNPNQPRKEFDETELICLAQSIKENGLLQPITVRRAGEVYELIAGERRLRASRIAGITEIPAIIVDKSAEESAVLAITENIQRSNLNCFEQGMAMVKLMEHYGFTQEQLAGRLGMAQCTVANKIRILKLSDVIRDKCIMYGFNERQVRALLKLPDELREEAVEEIKRLGFNVSQTERYIETLLHPIHRSKKRQWFFKEKRLYINNINKTLDTMKKSGIEFQSEQKMENGYLQYIIRIPQDV